MEERCDTLQTSVTSDVHSPIRMYKYMHICRFIEFCYDMWVQKFLT